MGLLDIGEDPLMGLATGLLSASGPSRMPVSFGQALGAGVQGMNDYRQQGVQNKLTDFKMQQMQQAQEAAAQQAEYKAKFLADPRIPEEIRQGVAAGVIDLADLAKPQKVGADETLVSPLNKIMGIDSVIAQGSPKAEALPASLKEFQAAQSNPAYGAFLQKQAEAKGTRVSMSPVVKVGNTFGEGIAKAGADRLMDQVTSATEAPKTASAASQILSALNTGKVLAGPATKWRMTAQQLFGNDPERLTSTRATIQGMAKLSLAGRGSLRGQGSVTDSEQALLQKAVSGDIDELTTDEIKMIAEGALKNAQVVYGQGKKARDALAKMPEFHNILPAFDLPDMPTGAPNSAPAAAGGFKVLGVRPAGG